MIHFMEVGSNRGWCGKQGLVVKESKRVTCPDCWGIMVSSYINDGGENEIPWSIINDRLIAGPGFDSRDA